MGVSVTRGAGGADGSVIRIDGLDDTINAVRGVDKQLPFAIALGLTRTAQIVKKSEVEEMGRVFDRPTPFTLRSLYVRPATKTKQESAVYIKDETVSTKNPAAKYLRPQIHGGDRNVKRFEKALQNKGIMPQDRYAVPGAGCKRDRYGNIPSSLIVQIMSWFQAFGEEGYWANIKEKRKRRIQAGAYISKMKGAGYFAITRPGGRLHPGIYYRTSPIWGAPIKPIIMFVKKPDYKPRFHFYEHGQAVANREWRGIFDTALNDAIRTAK